LDEIDGDCKEGKAKMKIDPKSPTFSIIYGIVVSIIAVSIARLFDSRARIPIFIIFYISGFAFAVYKGWTVLEHKKSESCARAEAEG